MVEIQYSPIKKIVVHEIIKYNLEDFIKLKAQPAPTGLPPPPLRWIDGIVFDFASMPLTPEMVNEQAHNGVVHWGFIEFTEMPQIQPNLVHPDTGVSRRVIDGSNNTAVQDAIRWLKGQPQWAEKAAV
ncbi:MAG: hypothetical protein ACYDAJ_04065 [Nitrosotalea sp.]